MKLYLSVLLIPISLASCNSDNKQEKSPVKIIYKDAPVEDQETLDSEAKESQQKNNDTQESTSEEVEKKADSENPYAEKEMEVDTTEKKESLTLEVYEVVTEDDKGEKNYDYKPDPDRQDKGVFQVFRAQVNGTIPLYRCQFITQNDSTLTSSGNVFLSPEPCKNHDQLGILGYVWKTKDDIKEWEGATAKLGICSKQMPVYKFNSNGVVESLHVTTYYAAGKGKESCPNDYSYDSDFTSLEGIIVHNELLIPVE